LRCPERWEKLRTVTQLPLDHLLDNVAWHSLAGPHAGLAAGTETARRYQRGLSALAGFADPERPDLAALTEFTDIGEHLFVRASFASVPAGWRVDAELPLLQMVWDGPMPDSDPSLAAVRLGSADVAAMLDLVALTQPGPFGARTIEMGEYFGIFDGERLIAMAGERMAAPALREVSGVCTHPDFQGRGHARRLMQNLIRREMERGETPFLHVVAWNTNAIALYERMGFRRRTESRLSAICREF
jgi:ribosomal protein S18 acetylase RimI-like enzyme